MFSDYDDMHMALFRVSDGFISAQVSEIFHEPLVRGKKHDLSARWVYLRPGVNVASLFWSAINIPK